MRIAFVTVHPADDVHAWSGSAYFMRTALEAAGCAVVPIDDLREPWRLGARVRSRVSRVCGRVYLADRRPRLLDAYAREIASRCAAVRPDVLLSPGSVPISHLGGDWPVAYWADATFAALHDYYPSFSRLTRASVRDGRDVDDRAARRASLAVYTSKWAADSAIHDHGADPAKVHVVPYGANLTDAPVAVPDRDHDVCRLLFVGVEWGRKGGPVAVEAVSALNMRGIRATLDVVGATPPGPVPECVAMHGFLSKRSDADSAALRHLYESAHFLIAPTRADATPVAFAEANAYGLPVLATATGGIASIVTPGRNGFLFDPGASGSTYADVVAETWSTPATYRELSESAFAEFRSRLNWASATDRVLELLRP